MAGVELYQPTFFETTFIGISDGYGVPGGLVVGRSASLSRSIS